MAPCLGWIRPVERKSCTRSRVPQPTERVRWPLWSATLVATSMAPPSEAGSTALDIASRMAMVAEPYSRLIQEARKPCCITFVPFQLAPTEEIPMEVWFETPVGTSTAQPILEASIYKGQYSNWTA